MSSDFSVAGRPASPALLGAALSGLLGLTVSCGSSNATPNPVGTDATSVDTSASVDTAVASNDASDGASVDASDDASDGASDSTRNVADALDGSDASTADSSDATLADADGGSSADAGFDIYGGDTLPDGGDTACVVDAPVILSTVSASGMTYDDFVAMCAALGGFIEIHPECGGRNSCKGLSYDVLSGILTNHTCAGLNACQGFSCVVP